MRVSTDPGSTIGSAPQVRLVGADGQQIGVVDTREALRQARDLDLDLVEVAPQASPPVCRIMDYGKYKYDRDVRQKEARRKQSRSGLKEIKFPPQDRPRLRHEEGPRRAVPQGRQQGQGHDHVPRSRDGPHELVARSSNASADLGEAIVVESFPKQEGRNMIMVIGPNKRYVEAQAKAAAKKLEAERAEVESQPS